MTEIEVVTTCYECDAEFDDDYDTQTCSVCAKEFCECCNADHAVKHCFEDCDAILKRKKK